jgi:hypothetical protein
VSETLPSQAATTGKSVSGYTFRSAPIFNSAPFVTPLRPFNEILADDAEADK